MSTLFLLHLVSSRLRIHPTITNRIQTTIQMQGNFFPTCWGSPFLGNYSYTFIRVTWLQTISGDFKIIGSSHTVSEKHVGLAVCLVKGNPQRYIFQYVFSSEAIWTLCRFLVCAMCSQDRDWCLLS